MEWDGVGGLNIISKNIHLFVQLNVFVKMKILAHTASVSKHYVIYHFGQGWCTLYTPVKFVIFFRCRLKMGIS